jgi:Flp pilus assembly protein TadD
MTGRDADRRGSSNPAAKSQPQLGLWLCLAALVLPFAFLGLLLVTSGQQLTLFTALRLRDNLRRPDMAQQLLEVGAQIWPASAELQDALGQEEYRRGNLLEAMVHFDQAVRLNPDLAAGRNDLGLGWLKYNQAGEAVSQILAAQKIDPDNPILALNLGRAYFAAGQYDQALASFRLAADLAPDSSAPWVQSGMAALNFSNLELAQRDFENALAIEAGSSQGMLGLGILRYIYGRPAEAVSYLQAASRLAPGDSQPHLYLGLVYTALGQPAQAKIELEIAASLTQDAAEIKTIHALLLEP